MRYRTIATLLFTTWLALSASLGFAADPVFKAARVTESRVYEREKGSIAIGGIRAQSASEWTSRVTVALEGARITAEWVPKTTISASAKDFRRGTDVEAATTRNQLLLKAPDGSIVTAKIVRRAAAEQSARN